MYYRKNTVNAMQTAMTALILLTSMSSFSCDVVFFPIHCFFLPAIHPLAVVVIFTGHSTDCV